MAEGLGCKAIKVTTKEEVAPAIKEAMEYDGPVVIECIIVKMIKYSQWLLQEHQLLKHSMHLI